MKHLQMSNFVKKILCFVFLTVIIGGFALIPMQCANALQFPSVNPPAETVQPAQSATAEPVNSQTTVQNTKNSADQKPGEAKIVLGKFFITMLWVVGSCAVLFVILLLYKKRMGGMNMSVQRPVTKEQDLTSPSTVDEAVRLFIEKF